jgi:hypothetical protein
VDLAEVQTRLAAVPAVLACAEENLGTGEAEAEFARVALSGLAGREGCFGAVVAGLSATLGAGAAAALEPEALAADRAVARFEAWLRAELPTMRQGQAAVSRAGMEDYLSNIALVDLERTPIEQMLEAASAELQRAQAMAAFETTRNAGTPERRAATTVAEQDELYKAGARQVAAFLTERKILSVPEWLGPPVRAQTKQLRWFFSDNRWPTFPPRQAEDKHTATKQSCKTLNKTKQNETEPNINKTKSNRNEMKRSGRVVKNRRALRRSRPILHPSGGCGPTTTWPPSTR